jgi:hypothetical protein
MDAFRRGVLSLIAHLEIGHQRAREAEAAGWVYVVIDDESEAHVHVVGPFPTPEAALIASERQKAEDRRWNPGEPLWTHHILPMFDDTKEDQ